MHNDIKVLLYHGRLPGQLVLILRSTLLTLTAQILQSKSSVYAL